MQNVRKPRPVVVPATLRELVIDLDQRLEGGDGNDESDVWLPGADWARLLTLALTDGQRPVYVGRPSPAAVAAEAVFAQRDAAELAELRETVRATKAALEQQRGALAHVLGAGVDTDFADCLQIARGYVAALDAERTPAKLEQTTARIALAKIVGWGTMNSLPDLLQVVQGYMLALDAERQRAQSAEDAAHALAAGPEEEDEDEHPECPRCGEADGHTGEDCANKGWAKPTPAELAAESLLRLNGAGWKRHAKKARETNSLDVCHHCGAGDQIAIEPEAVRNDDVLPDGYFCAGCRERLRENPREWDRHSPAMLELDRIEAEAAAPKKARGKRKGQVTLDEAVAAASPKPRAPGRPTKKFPQGGSDPTEKCTQCGAELGEHDGTKCPRAALQRGTVAIHDQQEGAPV